MSSQRGGFVLGLIVGLLIGLAAALAVALYITKVPVPFINKVPHRSAEQDAAEAAKNKDWDPNAPLAGKAAARPSTAASGRVDSAEARGGDAAGVGQAASTPGGARPASAAAGNAPASTREPGPAPSGAAGAASAPKSTGGAAEAFVYFVQAGAYSRAEDAEQQRAKLAMLGMETRVTEREQSGRVVYRVRLGPFDRRDEAEAAQARLGEAKVESNLLRAER